MEVVALLLAVLSISITAFEIGRMVGKKQGYDFAVGWRDKAINDWRELAESAINQLKSERCNPNSIGKENKSISVKDLN